MVLSDLIVRAVGGGGHTRPPTRLRIRRGMKSYPIPPPYLRSVGSRGLLPPEERLSHCRKSTKSKTVSKRLSQVARCSAGSTGSCGLGTSVARSSHLPAMQRETTRALEQQYSTISDLLWSMNGRHVSATLFLYVYDVVNNGRRWTCAFMSSFSARAILQHACQTWNLEHLEPIEKRYTYALTNRNCSILALSIVRTPGLIGNFPRASSLRRTGQASYI